jgi:type II secretory pathway pseudopilin PulG
MLVVIAMIAILAALLFPVFGTMREKTRQTTCLSQMHAIYQAVHLYKEDNNKYPPNLYGIVEFNGAQVVPMDQIKGRPLFTGGKYLNDRTLYFCPDNVPAPGFTAITTAIYPPTAGPALAMQPVVNGGGMPINFYLADSYDVGPQIDKNGNVVLNGQNPVIERHYSLDWTGPAATGPGDFPNQLKYPDPDHAKTVVTWCTYHVAVNHANVIPVLMLSGTCKPAQINQFVPQGPLKFSF